MKMPCPKCGGYNTTVTNTRMRKDAHGVPYIMRRRRCKKPTCQERFSSYENRVVDIS